MKLFGIDVSTYQGNIDWAKAKAGGVEFAVIRCGYGSDMASQDDSKFARNVSECEKLGIPFAVYLYSYADTDAKIQSEISHALRLVNGHKPFCVYIDMEDNSTVKLGKAKLTDYALRFCEAMKAKGYNAGVYANQNWFTNYLDAAKISKAGHSVWCARYSSSAPNIAAEYDIWQYSSTGRVSGISGNVDMNYMYRDIRNAPAPKKKTVNEIAQEVIDGKWGNGADRKAKLAAAGYSYDAVQARVNELLKAPAKKSVDTVAREVITGKWGNGSERKRRLTQAGYDYNAVQKRVNELLK